MSEVINLKVTRQENATYFKCEKNAVVQIELEEYLKGVVASEIGNALLEAAKAQAVAARTYAWAKTRNGRVITDQSSTDQAFRCSRMTSTAYPNAHSAVILTKGQMIFYNNKYIDTAVYSASNGGRTVSCKEKWGSNKPYLISAPDPYDKKTKNGHGVGMSQTGAANRAAAGQDYREILQFYYPGTTINNNNNNNNTSFGGTMTKQEKILAWVKQQIGNPYIYGATNQPCTPAYRRARAEQYPDYKYKIYSNCQQLSGKKSSCSGCKWYDNNNNIPKNAFDCAQLTRFGAKQAGIVLPSGATSQWKSNSWAQKGEIKDIPKDVLCCVFRQSGTSMAHVGWQLNGISYHAHGHSEGVVQTTNSQYSSWTHYAILKELSDEIDSGLEDKDVLYEVRVSSPTSRLNIREQPSITSARVSSLEPGAVVEVVEEVNGGEWYGILYNNKICYIMSQFVEKVDEQSIVEQPDVTDDTLEQYYVKVPVASRAEGELIVSVFKNAKIEQS